MKKILLLLLPVLLFAGCDKEKEDPNAVNAKSLEGTYTCTRTGTVYYYQDTTQKYDFKSPIDYTYDATITYLGENRVQLDMGGIFTGYVGTFDNVGNAIVFDTYTTSANTELLNSEFKIDIKGHYGKGYSGSMEINLNEIYSGTATGPNVNYIITGKGYTNLIKK